MILGAPIQIYVFTLPDGGPLVFLGQNVVRFRILEVDLPEKVSLYMILGALAENGIFQDASHFVFGALAFFARGPNPRWLAAPS